jgi:phage gp36-like protein
LPLEQTVIDNSILPIICAHITRYHLCDTNITKDIADKAIWARKQLREIALGVIVITKNIAVPALKSNYNHFEKFIIY